MVMTVPSLRGEPGTIRVLLAEDDDDHVLLLQRALRHYPRPVEIIVARDGQEAIEYLQTADHARPDLILLDINMPKLTGLEVLRVLKSDPLFLPIPTVMLTTSAREEDRTASLSGGANDYIIKPVNFRKVTESLFELLDRYFAAGS